MAVAETTEDGMEKTLQLLVNRSKFVGKRAEYYFFLCNRMTKTMLWVLFCRKLCLLRCNTLEFSGI